MTSHRTKLLNFCLLVMATMAMFGCAQPFRSRIPPPGSSLEGLLSPGFQPPAIEVPAGGIPANGNSAPQINLPPATAAPTGFTPPTTVAPASFSQPVTTPAAPASTGIIRAPESGWQSIRGDNESKPSTNKANTSGTIIRGQSPQGYGPPPGAPPAGYPANPYPTQPGFSAQNLPGPPVAAPQPQPQSLPNGVPSGPAPTYGAPGFGPSNGGPAFYTPSQPGQVIAPPFDGMNPNLVPTPDQIPIQPTPVDVLLQETRTGRFMFGVGVNSDLGVTGNVTIDERNFDILNPPTSWDDFLNGTAWRGAGQGFRLEAQPGNNFQRYLVSFTEPYLLNTPVSSNLSGYYFDRNYSDWLETRLGGRVGLGYRITPDLSLAGSFRAEDVNIHSPRVIGVPELDRSLGHSGLYGAKASLTHDTRDIPFFPTEGHLIDVSYEQVFGTFVFPRFEAEMAQYFLLKERPDGSGRHTIGLTLKYGMQGNDSPIYEHYFAGGFSSLRGFSFRGASPVDNTVRVGGRMQLIGSAEYFFPLTADDMIKGVAFCDFGDVEENLSLNADNFRVAPGFGFRISVPALGPAPLAFDFAFPVAYAPTDQRQVFSFYVGFARQ